MKGKNRRVLKTAAILLFTLAAAVFLTSCARQTRKLKAEILENTGINISDGTVKEFYYTGGFHGDGTVFSVLRISNGKAGDEIKKREDWKKLPLDDTVKALLYGTDVSSGDLFVSVGPYFTNEDGETLFPQVYEGYYYFYDRDSENKEDILNRPSLNFTAAIYDTDSGILYYGRMDT